MLRTRLWMGAILVALTVGVLLVDNRLPPYFPFLLLLVLALALVACFEILHLLPANRRPATWLCYAGVLGMVAANWIAHVWPAARTIDADPWHWILGVLTAVVLAAFLWEMATFLEPPHPTLSPSGGEGRVRGPGESLGRIAMTIWLVAYLGLLPSFLAQLRWPSAASGTTLELATVGLALTIFVPKCCDSGAYFTGRLLGRHKMAPVLSPKKTWEGAIGGLLTAVAATIGINRLGPALPPNLAVEVGFGLTVGLAGMLGDLAESLIKRDCRQKDASQVMPGFGGVLDVVDAIVFAAPVAYGWLRF